MNTWSSSSFAVWLRKVFNAPVLPFAETSEGWKEYEESAKAHSKILYYITDKLIDQLEDIFSWPQTQLDNFAYWVSNRFIQKNWSIDTKLDKNSWHETDQRILHGMFEELIKFIEVEKGWMFTKKNKHFPYFFRKLIFTSDWQAGVDYLIWETKLMNDDSWCNKDDPSFGQPTSQAKTAEEILELYCWWKFIRPERKDPMDLSGYSEYFDKHLKDKSLFTYDEEGTLLSQKTSEIEQQQYDEDNKMLIRLIKIRSSLWT